MTIGTAFAWAVLFGLGAGARVGAQAQGTAQSLSTGDHLAATVDSVASRVLKSTGVPSASVAVVTHGRVAYVQAYGLARLDPRVPARPDMRYGIGSISKQFTASAILLLQQDGKISLDDHVSRYVPGLTRGDEVTIRELLSHTSGYQDYWPQDYVPPFMEQATTAQGILDHWAKQPLDFEPGSRWQYSNTNFVIAGKIVEKASGMPFFQFLRTRILDPLQLTSAVDFDTGGPGAIEPVGYLRYALGPLRVAPRTAPGWVFSAGELAMTARDLARWDISIIDKSLLSPASYRALTTTVLLNSGVSTGYGLGVNVALGGGRRALEHSGEVSGFTAENIVFPDDSAAIVVLTNQDAAPAAGAIAQQIARMMFTTEDAQTQARTALALRIFQGLQHGTVDRSLFTANANAYFSNEAVRDFASSLAPLGAPKQFVQVSQQNRGGMTERSYRAMVAGRTLDVWTYETSDGKLEQYQVAPLGDSGG
ncbi:MAG: serine hydrolase domain-containing protein [Gemmatimonadaceae bacterium]